MLRDARYSEDGGVTTRRGPSALEAALARLEGFNAHGLVSAWTEHFGTAPPPALPPRLLLLAIAYDLQASALGGLSPSTEKRLARIADGSARNGPARPTPIRLKPGATLLRDWGGQAWRVEVKADGTFGFEGSTWRSLSAIARKITGTSRSGPAFFGLRGGGGHGAA